MALVRSIDSFAFDERGIPRVVTPNELFDADDPVVVRFPDMFTPVVATAVRGGVEQATAAPGEHRNFRRPR